MNNLSAPHKLTQFQYKIKYFIHSWRRTLRLRMEISYYSRATYYCMIIICGERQSKHMRAAVACFFLHRQYLPKVFPPYWRSAFAEMNYYLSLRNAAGLIPPVFILYLCLMVHGERNVPAKYKINKLIGSYFRKLCHLFGSNGQ